MSRIYFHTPTGTGEVLGSERFHLGGLIDDYTDTFLRKIQDTYPDRIRGIVSPKALAENIRLYNTPQEFRKTFTALSSYNKRLLAWKGTEFETFSTKMNTAHRSGDDDLILATMIYSTCEVHGWVDGPDREWFADKIDHALCAGTFRESHGWEGVIELLLANDHGEVVMSYSVTGGFPDLRIVSPDIDWDDYGACSQAEKRWEELGAEGRWKAGMGALHRDGTLQISPLKWGRQYAGANFALQDLMYDDWRERLDKAVDMPKGPIDPWTK